jgi:hypothetical protein
VNNAKKRSFIGYINIVKRKLLTYFALHMGIARKTVAIHQALKLSLISKKGRGFFWKK